MPYKLYVFLRSDLESMTPGKAAAQVAHAASQHMWSAMEDRGLLTAISDWMGCEDGFGTTVVLDGGSFNDDGTDHFPHSWASSEKCDFWVGEIDDPSYPIRDGKKTHLLPLRTCYYVFFNTDELPEISEYVKQFSLYTGNHD